MSSKNNNKINVPEARAAMDKFKMEAAAEVGVNLKEGYNGDLNNEIRTDQPDGGGASVRSYIPGGTVCIKFKSFSQVGKLFL